MEALLESASDPFQRDHFAPGHFTASAFVLDPEGERLLLILHGKLGLWLQPGGHWDPEDGSLQAAARREVHEETGLGPADLEPGAPLLDVDVHRIPPNPRKGEPEHRHYDLRVLLRARSTAIQAASDARDARWVPLAQVHAQATDASVRRAVERVLALREGA